MNEGIPNAPAGLLPKNMLESWRAMSSKVAAYEHRQWELLRQLQASQEKIWELQRAATELRDEVRWLKARAAEKPA